MLLELDRHEVGVVVTARRSASEYPQEVQRAAAGAGDGASGRKCRGGLRRPVEWNQDRAKHGLMPPDQ